MQLPKISKDSRGFTLIELLVVIVVIGILATGAFVALDPATRFEDSRDSTRWTDVTAILDAVKVDQVDNGGAYIAAIEDDMVDGDVYMITDGGGTDCDGANAFCDVAVTTETVGGDHCVDLAGLVTEGYLGDVPIGPDGAGAWAADLGGYQLTKSATGIITVQSCESENTGDIKVSR